MEKWINNQQKNAPLLANINILFWKAINKAVWELGF